VLFNLITNDIECFFVKICIKITFVDKILHRLAFQNLYILVFSNNRNCSIHTTM